MSKRRVRSKGAPKGKMRASSSKSDLDKRLESALRDLQDIKAHYDGKGAPSRVKGPGKGSGGLRPPPSPASAMTAGSGKGRRRRSAKGGASGGAASGKATAGTKGAAPPDESEAGKRLRMAETVMKKLFQRNLRLEEELAAAKEAAAKAREAAGAGGAGGPGGRPLTRSGTGTPADGEEEDDGGAFGLQLDTELDMEQMGDPDEGSLDGLLLVHVQQEKHLRRLLEERDRTIEELRGAVSDMRRATTPASSAAAEAAAKAASAHAGRSTSEEIASLQSRLSEALEDAARYQQGYVKARADYRRLVSARVKQATEKKAAKYGSTAKPKQPVAGAARKLIEALGERLTVSEEERNAETAAFNRKLLEAERQHCDWFVEKRLMEDRLAALTAEIREQDEMADRMELCVHSLFERLRQLEITNHNLRRKLGLASTTGSRSGTPLSMSIGSASSLDGGGSGEEETKSIGE